MDSSRETSQIEVNRLVKQYLTDYKEVYAYRHIEVQVEEEGTFFITMNEMLAVVLFTNLLKNAFVHNVEGGYIRIIITECTITFCNRGDRSRTGQSSYI